jgi:hypothetical protein
MMGYIDDFMTFYGFRDPVAEARKSALAPNQLDFMARRAKDSGNQRKLDQLMRMRNAYPQNDTEIEPTQQLPQYAPNDPGVLEQIISGRNALEDALIPITRKTRK